MTSATSGARPPSADAPDAPPRGVVIPLTGPQAGPHRGPPYWLGRLWLRVFGWSIVGAVPPMPRAVVIAAPHTSNWDLPFALAIGWVLGMRVHWLGKDSLFRGVRGRLMYALNGIPVDRSRRNNLVSDVAAKLRAADTMYLMVPPEGTRGKSSRWKSGFYWIAHEADVPIILGYLDFGRKRGGLGSALYTTGDLRADFEKIRVFYDGIHGRNPSLQGEVTLGDDTAKQ
jgi:1-acyl-sn-glycerol-3-phosphate acyltransferase